MYIGRISVKALHHHAMIRIKREEDDSKHQMQGIKECTTFTSITKDTPISFFAHSPSLCIFLFFPHLFSILCLKHLQANENISELMYNGMRRFKTKFPVVEQWYGYFFFWQHETDIEKND